MTTQVFIGTFFVEYCYKCGIPFGLTNDFRGRRLDDGQTFYCPSEKIKNGEHEPTQ